MTNYKAGKWAEFVARWYMRFCGYRIVARNFVTGRGTSAGEVDFIAMRGDCLIFVEVKKRQNLNDAAYAIQARQRQRIARGAAHFMQRYPQYVGYDIRFDAILVAKPFSLRHIKNAWQSDL